LDTPSGLLERLGIFRTLSRFNFFFRIKSRARIAYVWVFGQRVFVSGDRPAALAANSMRHKSRGLRFFSLCQCPMGLFRSGRRGRLPISGAFHHPAHLVEPPLGPLPSLLAAPEVTVLV
jgi:hypothetical protein